MKNAMGTFRSFSKQVRLRAQPSLKACALILISVAATFCTPQQPLKKLELLYQTPKNEAYVQVNFCTQHSEMVKTRLKYIFILDKSGSNAQNYKINPDGSTFIPLTILPSLATDPTGSRRYGEMIKFLNGAPQDPYRYYSLINFSTDAHLVQGFTNDRTAFQHTVQREYANLQDQGATNYENALDIAYDLINSDIAAAKANTSETVASSYIMVFISDGFPILQIDTSVNPPAVVAQQPSSILQRVRNIIALQSDAKYVDSINLYTGYYYVDGNADPAAGKLLKDMAEKAGNGVGYEFGTGKTIDFSLFSVPPKLLKYNLSEVLVTNANVLWGDHGNLLLDSDGDGISDEDELRMGSDPFNSDSDGNGVSDFVEYQLSGNLRPCQTLVNGKCSAAGAKDFRTPGTCGSITPLSTTGGRIVYPDSDGDGLNDCEELLLGNQAGINNFDSNGDFIPDWLAFKNHVPMKAGDFAPAGTLDKIKFFTPLEAQTAQLLNFKPYRYDLNLVSSTLDQDCYNLKVYDIATIGSDNLIRVYLMQNTSAIYNKTILTVAEKRFTGNSKVLMIDSQEKELPGVWK